MNDFFTCIGKGHGAPAVPATREDWEKMRNEKWLADMCRRIAGGNEALKSRLPIWTPGCAGFKDNHRAIADAVKPLRRLMLDFDEKGHSQEILERSMQLQQQGKWEILLVEESVRKGTHVLVTLPEGMTPQEAQKRFSNDVGFQADPALKDVARCIYMVPAENTLYVNERMFSPSPNIGKTTQPHVDAPGILRRSAPLDDRNGDAPLDNNSCQKVYPTAFKGTPYAVIIAEWFRRNGNEPQPGERNEKLHRLAAHLRYITDNNEEHLLQILPSYGLAEEEMRSLVHHACTAKFYGMPRSLKKLLAELESEKGNDGTEEMKPGEYSLSSAQPPQMPRRLPPLIRLLVSKTPPIYRPAVAHAVFPSLATHLWKVYFRYIDNVEHQATLMNLLMAGTGAGKNCIAEPINRIMADIRRRDAENLQREKEWKSEMQTKGSNKDKRKRPDGLVVQEIDPDMTNAAFVQRLADAEERFLYTKMNEIDQFDALKTSARSKAHFQIMCLAFDPGNVYGQTRVGTSSVSERVCIRFNWNASTTIKKGQAYFQSVLTDGPISRLNVCTIDERPIGSDMPVFGTYDAAFDEELRPYIERLNAARGTIECRQARMLAKKLVEECA